MRKTTREVHGNTGKPEYYTWSNMKSRCHNSSHKFYPLYGGRGIFVCKEWRDSFLKFYEYVGNRPGKGYSLDRIDVNKGYEPGNVRWATQKQQQNNMQRNMRLTYNDENKTVHEWAAILGIKPVTLYTRIYRGWDTKKAIETPVS